MTTLTYRLPAELEQRLKATRADTTAPANGFFHDGKLNMGPAILLAGALSIGCWAVILTLGFKLFH
jgi:hypothetical protein